MKRVLLFMLCFLLLGIGNTFAQCAMCRSTLENNFSNGNPGVGAGINTGILYLLVMPYLAVIILGYFWLKSSRNAQQELSGRASSR